MRQIAAVYPIEARIRGQSAEERLAVRQAETKPLMAAFKTWTDDRLKEVSAVHYARVPRLFSDLELAHSDGRFAKVFRTLTKVDLLVLDLCCVRSYVASPFDAGFPSRHEGVCLNITEAVDHSVPSFP